MRFALKMGASIVLLVAIALGLVDTLNYFKYKTLLANLVRSRMEVVTADLQNGVQEALRLGLSLADTRTAEALITQAKKQDPLIVSISVFQAAPKSDKQVGDSQILYDTDTASASKPPLDDWVSSVFSGDDAEKLWYVSDDGGNVVGATLVDRLEQPIGGIALRYSGAYEQQHLDAMRAQLITSAGEVLALAIVINLGGILLVFRPISARLRAMNLELKAAAAAAASGDSTDPVIIAFGERIRAATAAMDRTEEALDRMDREKRASP